MNAALFAVILATASCLLHNLKVYCALYRKPPNETCAKVSSVGARVVFIACCAVSAVALSQTQVTGAVPGRVNAFLFAAALALGALALAAVRSRCMASGSKTCARVSQVGMYALNGLCVAVTAVALYRARVSA